MNYLFLENISDQLRWVGTAFFRFSTICTAIYDILLFALKHCHRKFTLWVHSITCSSFRIFFWYNQTTFSPLVHGREIIENPPPTLHFGTPCLFVLLTLLRCNFFIATLTWRPQEGKTKNYSRTSQACTFLFKFFRPVYMLKLRKY